MHCVFFVLWLSGFVALPAVYDDPVITVLSLASAVMRVIGNIYKLFDTALDKIYNEEFFDILGPKILTDGGQSVNPFPVYGNLDEVNNRINKLKKLIKIYNSRVQRFLLRIYMSIKYAFVKKRLVYNGELKKYGVALHGYFLIFSKHYY